MYAIIADGGRQYMVRQGDVLQLDFRDVPAGDAIEFSDVLAISDQTADGLKVGQPTIAGAKVTGEVIGLEFGPKIIVQKLRRRKNSRRKTGHRQMFTRVRIEKIES
jgi:large subunit ribosomal protein L21